MSTVSYRFGGKSAPRLQLQTNPDLVVVRTVSRGPLDSHALSRPAREVMSTLEPWMRFADAGVEVLRVRSGSRADRDRAREALEHEQDVRFAGRVLTDPALRDAPAGRRDPVLYTENVFVKFAGSTTAARMQELLTLHGLTVKRPVAYARNAFFTAAKEGIGLDVFATAEALLDEPEVELCHPELVRRRRMRGAFPQQWHLGRTSIGGREIDAHAAVTDAWAVTRGAGSVVAVIDEGIDVGHEELRSAGKIVAPHDAASGTDDPRPHSRDESHGTAVAGVACASGSFGASGVAPEARLMPIRLVAPLGSQSEGDAFAWAADHHADVISCSWGPADGDWSDPGDPRHHVKVPLPDSTRLAIDYALAKGRGGKGCVVCWAAGNGNESTDLDGYASHPGVIAVGACNDRGRRSIYSDFGRALWCCFPSSDIGDAATGHAAPSTPGIWTTDRSGHAGYNAGGARAPGDVAGNYTATFGGTSSAAPGVAGVAALVLAADPALSAREVADVLKRSCDRIDPEGAGYDAKGHSTLLGFGRVNAAAAVALAVASARNAAPKRSRARPQGTAAPSGTVRAQRAESQSP